MCEFGETGEKVPFWEVAGISDVWDQFWANDGNSLVFTDSLSLTC